MSSATGYRPEIDGLRAVSILPVVAFHAGLTAIPGGFVGVDVFFVISGYLIGSIILSGLQTGTFSILHFYERRVRRILPALLTMLLGVSVAATLFMLPNEFAPFPPSLIATLLFVPNMLFWRRSGYFAPAAEQEPLLHTWSIGIEEQFYLFVPLLLIALHRFAPRSLRWVLIALTIGSLALCILISPTRPGTAFFLLPTRAWELAIGLVLATLPARPAARFDGILAASGLAAIVAAALTYTEAVAWPGYWALLPVAGAALVIRYSPGTRVCSGLAWPPIVFIGLISYSLYLWHWPLIVFGRLLGHDSAAAIAVIVTLSFAVATLSWRFVERPFRQKGRIGRFRLFTVTGGVSALLLLFGIAAARPDGWPGRWSAEALAMDAGRSDFSRFRACHRDDNAVPIARSCVLGGRPATTAVWGDSHGVEIAAALAETRFPVMAITYSSCPPSLGLVSPDRAGCTAHNERVIRHFERSPDIRTVILAAHWEHWGRQADFWPGLLRAVRRLQRAGKQVLIFGPSPVPGYAVPGRLARGGARSFPRADYEARLAPELRSLRRLEAIAPVFWPDRALCTGDACALVVDGAPAFYDDHHLSMHGARYLARRLHLPP